MANVQIPNLPPVIALTGDELFEGVQAGSSVRISLGQMIASARTGLPTTVPLPISAGGTGATTAGGAQTSLGLGTMATQNASNVNITGGSISGVSFTVGTFGLGTAGSPSITFTGDTNTGIWSPGAETIAVSTNGIERMRVHPSGGVSVGSVTDPGANNLSTAGSFVAPLGAAATPSIAFSGDPNTGVWSPAADTVAVSTNGSERVRLFSSGGVSIGNTTDPGATNLSVTGVGSFGLGTALLPSHTFNGDLNTGMWSPGADTIAFSTNGGERVRVFASGGVSVGNTTDPGANNLSVTGAGLFGLGAVGAPSYAFNGDPNTGMWSPAADTIAFSTNGGERIRVFASGGVSVGNTTDPGATNLSVTGSVTTPTLTNAGTLNVSATGANVVTLSTASTERFRVGPAGQLGIGGANYGTAGQAFISGGAGAATSWGTLGLAGGGTGATSAPAAAAALYGFTSTPTAAGTTVLTNASSQYQLFTGTSTQTITLPVTSTLATGWSFHIVNSSTGNLTINSSGGNLVGTVIPGTTAMVTCILTSGTTAASWEFGVTDFNTLTGTGSVVMSTGPTITSGAFNGTVGATTPSTGAFTTLSASSTVSGTGFASYLASPPSIGATTPNLGKFSTLTATSMNCGDYSVVGNMTIAPTITLSLSGNGGVRMVVWDVIFTEQPTPTSIAATATLTTAQLATGIIQYTGATGTLTLPLGTSLDSFYSLSTDVAFDFTIINTGTGTATVAVNTGVTSVGALSVATATSATFRLRRTAANTWIVYRV